MPKPRTDSGNKNLISENLIRLRQKNHLSQRDLAKKLQLVGCDMDRNVITRIETQKRYVTDIELVKLCEVLKTTFEELTKNEQ
ncbi:MAG: helix-turn-helix transcriptional regulator [Lachnospiraceae bacterium]|nr:helix-turn-helix transcriptional regulator [Lachnospiraceae bacterium]